MNKEKKQVLLQLLKQFIQEKKTINQGLTDKQLFSAMKKIIDKGLYKHKVNWSKEGKILEWAIQRMNAQGELTLDDLNDLYNKVIHGKPLKNNQLAKRKSYNRLMQVIYNISEDAPATDW